MGQENRVRVATLTVLGLGRAYLRVCDHRVRPILGSGRTPGRRVYIVRAMSTFERSSLALVLHAILYATIDAFRRVPRVNRRFSQTVTMTVSFTSGSVSLATWALTPQGYKWGAENKDTGSDQSQGFQTSMGEKCQLLLSDRIRAYFLVLESGIWNFSFTGSAFSSGEEGGAR